MAQAAAHRHAIERERLKRVNPAAYSTSLRRALKTRIYLNSNRSTQLSAQFSCTRRRVAFLERDVRGQAGTAAQAELDVVTTLNASGSNAMTLTRRSSQLSATSQGKQLDAFLHVPVLVQVACKRPLKQHDVRRQVRVSAQPNPDHYAGEHRRLKCNDLVGHSRVAWKGCAT